MDIVKCKGHATWVDIDAGRATLRAMRGNGAADLHAVRGTSIAEDVAPTNRQAYKEASSYYRFLLTISGKWSTDTTPYDEWLDLPTAVAVPPPPTTRSLYHPEFPHDVLFGWDRHFC